MLINDSCCVNIFCNLFAYTSRDCNKVLSPERGSARETENFKEMGIYWGWRGKSYKNCTGRSKVRRQKFQQMDALKIVQLYKEKHGVWDPMPGYPVLLKKFIISLGNMLFPICWQLNVCNLYILRPNPKKKWCMGPYDGGDYNLTLCPLQSRLQHIYLGIGQPSARVHPYVRVDFIPQSGTSDLTSRVLSEKISVRLAIRPRRSI